MTARRLPRLGAVAWAAALAASLIAAPAVAASPTAAPSSTQATTGCLRQDPPPAPPAGGAVFARPLDPQSSAPNVVVVDPTALASDCGGAAGDIMTHPTSITIAAGAALRLHDDVVNLFSDWGAKNVTSSDPAPDFYPGLDWTTTDAEVMPATTMLQNYGSCRSCAVAGTTSYWTLCCILGGIAYYRDLSGADLTGATLDGDLHNLNLSGAVLSHANLFSRVHYADQTGGATLTGATLTGVTLWGSFNGWSLSGLNLPGADLTGADLTGADLTGVRLDHAVVDDTTIFTKTDLRGAQLTQLQFSSTPRFDGVRVGPFNGSCTTFTDTNLVHAGLTFTADPGCENGPLLPGSSVDLGVIATYRDHPGVNFDRAFFVVDAADRGDLAGQDLHGINLTGGSFVGLPADLQGTIFDGASLQHTSFELADLSGATFHNANAAGASFRDAHLAARGQVKGADFAGPNTVLDDADFAGADLSGASFVGASLAATVFSRALAVNTDFSGVRAPNAVFNGAHIYGDGQAFDNATNLQGADFSGAVLAGKVDLSGGFDLTSADLTGAKFDGTDCVSCKFTGSTLDDVNFSHAYLPGVVLSGTKSLKGVNLLDAWLYCGDLSNSSCAKVPGSQPRWAWPLALGSGEAYGPVPFGPTDLQGVSLADVAVCPDGKEGSTNPAGCDGHLLPATDQAPPLPAPCSAAGRGDCPTVTSTLFDATSIGSPLAVAAANPPVWATTLTGRGYYLSLSDGTIRLAGDGAARIVAGQPGQHCPGPANCGDGASAAQALLGAPSGLAVGLDGSLYLADPVDHRVRRIDPSGTITTVAGTGASCGSATDACGDGGPAATAQLSGPYGVWASPGGELFIADGHRGIRTVSPSGIISTVAGTTAYDIRGITGDASGQLYATSNDPDYLLRIDLAAGTVTKVVGTGTSGYNGTTNTLGMLLPGTSVQINHPEGVSAELNGDIVFADAGNDLIRAYVPSSDHVVDLGGLVANGTPAGGFNGDGHPANQTELNQPQDVTVTRGALFVVADTGNDRLRQLGPNPPAAGSLLRVPHR